MQLGNERRTADSRAVIDAGEREASRVEAALARLLPSSEGLGVDEGRLIEAMRYAVRGGKRLRARLVYGAGALSGAEREGLDRLASAVEFVHAFAGPRRPAGARRRRLAAWRAELAHAVRGSDGDTGRRRAAGARLRGGERGDGRSGEDAAERAFAGAGYRRRGHGRGQVLDIAGEGRALSADELERMHRLKTGALIHAAVALGAGSGRLPPEEMAALDGFGQEIGLAFQIQDDVLDATVETTRLVKPRGSDAQRGKSTYVRLLGVAAAKQAAEQRLERALRHLAPFGDRADRLAALATAMVRRDH